MDSYLMYSKWGGKILSFPFGGFAKILRRTALGGIKDYGKQTDYLPLLKY